MASVFEKQRIQRDLIGERRAGIRSEPAKWS